MKEHPFPELGETHPAHRKLEILYKTTAIEHLWKQSWSVSVSQVHFPVSYMPIFPTLRADPIKMKIAQAESAKNTV